MSATVVKSSSSSDREESDSRAILRKIRRTILPDRVLGRADAK